MNETQALSRMVAPGDRRPGKYREGVIQIWLTRACDKSCFNCTQFSNLSGKPGMITLENFEIAVKSLKDYWGVVGIFGGNPAMHPEFAAICDILRSHIPKEQCGLWCNNPLGKGAVMRQTFNPSVSNLNVHLDRAAFDEFKRDWPESQVVGHSVDSRHSPAGGLAMLDVIDDEETRWDLISNCDINRHWSAMIGQFRGEPRAWFCEIAGAQSMLMQHDSKYPDTGLDLKQSFYKMRGDHPYEVPWWQLPMSDFRKQVKQHCHRCAVPLCGLGELAQASDTDGIEQTSETYANVYRPKKKRRVQIVQDLEQVKPKALEKFTHYLQNASKK